MQAEEHMLVTSPQYSYNLYVENQAILCNSTYVVRKKNAV